MQYILTKDEYDELVKKKNFEIGMDRQKLQLLCTRIANEMPVKWGWSKDEEAKPWGCILTQEDEWYCDSCPVKAICPNPNKNWSK